MQKHSMYHTDIHDTFIFLENAIYHSYINDIGHALIKSKLLVVWSFIELAQEKLTYRFYDCKRHSKHAKEAVILWGTCFCYFYHNFAIKEKNTYHIYNLELPWAFQEDLSDSEKFTF